MMKKVILASGSPRRKMLLEGAGIGVDIDVSSIDEASRSGEKPKAFVERMAREKALNVLDRHRGEDVILVAADTIVVQGDRILGKPRDVDDAYRMLSSLSDGVHEVMTGVCVIESKREVVESFVITTNVHFCKLSEQRIREYIASGEPMDKAGSYGIQGGAAGFVSRIEGSYTNVVGLPLCETLEAIERHQNN